MTSSAAGRQVTMIYRTIYLVIISMWSLLAVAAQPEVQPDTETVVRERKTVGDDGSEETEVRSGKVRPARDGGPRVGEIYAEDQRKVIARVESLNLYSFSFGPGGGTNMNNEAMFYSLSFARHFEVNTNAEIRLGAATFLPSRAKGNFTSMALGASWLISTSDISPIIGAEFGYGFVSAEGRDVTGGFSAGAHAGVRFFRTAKTQLSLEVNAKTLFISGERPYVMGAALGILY